ncbi:hypothetical protein T05_2004, partial [Trichinella murrelli]
LSATISWSMISSAFPDLPSLTLEYNRPHMLSGRVGFRKLWSGIFKCHNCGTQNMLARAEACHGQTGNMDARKWMQKMVNGTEICSM